MNAAEVLFAYGFDGRPVFDFGEVLDEDMPSALGEPLGEVGSLGDDTTAANVGAHISVDAQGNVTLPNATQAAQTAFQNLPADVKGQLVAAQKTYAQLTPAIDLAKSVAGGQKIDPQQAVLALASMATFVGGPVAGAAVGAIAEGAVQLLSVMQQLAQAIGLYPKDLQTFRFVGWLRQPEDTIPYGPGDPLWIHIASVADMQNFFAHDPRGQAMSGETGFDQALTNMVSLALSITDPGTYTGDWHNPVFVPGPLPPSMTDFEKFFGQLLLKNLEFWLNGQPSVPPRDLLRASAKVWNGQHTGGCGQDVTCPNPSSPKRQAPGPVNYQVQNDAASICFLPAPQDVWQRNHDNPDVPSDNTSIVSLLLGPSGIPSGAAQWGFDPGITVNDLPPLCVNMGPEINAPAHHVVALHIRRGTDLATAPGPHGAAAPSSSTTAAPLIASVAVGGLGVAAWYLLGKPLTFAAVRRGWHEVAREFFR